MNKHVRIPTDADVQFVAANIRETDAKECELVSQTPYDAIAHGVATSHLAYTLLDNDGTPVAILGVSAPYPTGLGAIWLLGTPGIEKVPMTFLRQSRHVLKDILTEYEGVFNYTLTSNTVHVRWLRWLGFSFLREVEMNNHQFYEFIKLRG